MCRGKNIESEKTQLPVIFVKSKNTLKTMIV